MNRVFQRRVLDRNSENPKSKIENPNWAGIVAIAVAFTMCGAVAQAQQTGKIHRIGFLSGEFPVPRPTSKHFDKGCATSVTSRARTLSSNTDIPKGKPIGTLTFFQTLSASKLTLSSGMALGRPSLQRKQPARSPLS
jgi:hypothetical protein